MKNPLLEMSDLPPFRAIEPAHVEPAIDALLAHNRAEVARLLEAGAAPSWDSLVAPLEALDDRLSRTWSPVGHMNAVVNGPELRAAYEACLPKLSDYATEMGQNEALYQAFQALRDGAEYATLDTAQQKVIDNTLRDFRLSGVALPPAQKARYKELMSELSQLSTQFSNNVLDATNGWTLDLSDPAELAGVPESSLGMMKQAAERAGQPEAWRVTLEFPSYRAVMTYADSRELRAQVYQAFVTRASDQGPQAGEWDNSEVMEEILRRRHELAGLLGFASYAERSLATKMADDPAEVIAFLRDLGARSHALAKGELEELRAYAQAEHGLEELEAWDYGYYGEKLRQAKYAISQEDLKPYFPEGQVLKGLFEVVQRLYGLSVREVPGVEVWHDDARHFEIYDGEAQLRGRFYLDLYARPHKRGGAWMDECQSRRLREGGDVQTPTAYLVCNFARGRRPGPLHPRRGPDPLPRVWPRPAPHAHPGRLRRGLRD